MTLNNFIIVFQTKGTLVEVLFFCVICIWFYSSKKLKSFLRFLIMLLKQKLHSLVETKHQASAFQENIYCTRVLLIQLKLIWRWNLKQLKQHIVPAPLQPALDYKPRILDQKIWEFPCFVQKLTVILTALQNKQQWKMG